MRHWFEPDGECISRLPDIEGDKPKRQKFKRSPIGFFHIDIAEVQTVDGKPYLFVGIDRTSKFEMLPENWTLTQAVICSLLIFTTKEIDDVEAKAACP